jgi:hypothetical protein
MIMPAVTIHRNGCCEGVTWFASGATSSPAFIHREDTDYILCGCN